MKRKTKALALFVAGLQFASCAHSPDTGSVNATPVSDETRIPASDDPWSDWDEKNPAAGLWVLRNIRENLLKNNLHDPHVNYGAYREVDCSKVNVNFRTADGTCYDEKRPHVGAAGTAFGRNVPPQYLVRDPQRTLMTPNPALVSKEFFTREEFKPVPFLNMLAAVWIQFMNHDWLTHGANEVGNQYRVQGKEGSAAYVDRTKDSSELSASFKPQFGKVTLNEVTHWWDASQIYGSSQDEQNRLRAFQNGKMIMEKNGGREYLPKNDQFNPRNNRQNQGYELTGFSDNWWVGLSMLHTLFVKEHNAIADQLYRTYVKGVGRDGRYTWSEGLFNSKKFTKEELDEHIFQTARLVNSAILAKIHTVEWTPAILPNPTLIRAMCANWYGLANPKCMSGELGKLPSRTDPSRLDYGYLISGIVGDKRDDHGVPFSITEEFTSVYRLHSLLPENLELKRLSERGSVSVPFLDTRNEKSAALMESYDLQDLYYSFGTQLPGQLVLNNFPQFMANLEVPGHGTMDLGMVDIMRDRERGVPRYNQFRRAIGLKPIASYSDFFERQQNMTPQEQARRAKVLAKFNRVYGKTTDGKDNVEAIDLLVGTLAEEVRPGNFGFGETMFQIFILMASRRLMADKFFTSHYSDKYYTKEGRAWVDRATLGSVITRHMPQLAPKVANLPTAFSPWNR